MIHVNLYFAKLNYIEINTVKWVPDRRRTMLRWRILSFEFSRKFFCLFICAAALINFFILFLLEKVARWQRRGTGDTRDRGVWKGRLRLNFEIFEGLREGLCVSCDLWLKKKLKKKLHFRRNYLSKLEQRRRTPESWENRRKDFAF